MQVRRFGLLSVLLLAPLLLWSQPSKAAWVGGAVPTGAVCNNPNHSLCPALPPAPLSGGCITSGDPPVNFPTPLTGSAASSTAFGASGLRAKPSVISSKPSGGIVRPLEGPLYYGYSIECDTAKHACAFLAKALGNGDENWATGPNGGPGICSAVGTDHLGNPIIEGIGPYCWDQNGVEQTDEENPAIDTGCGPPPPTITSDKPYVWWFGKDVKPDEANYPTKIKLTATPAGANSYDWTISTGTNEVVFSTSKGTTAKTTTNTVEIESTGSSPPKTPNDITITATQTVKKKTSLPSKDFNLSALTPYQNSPLGSSCTPYSDVSNPNFTGWDCEIFYGVFDQMGNSLPASSIPFNELYTSARSDNYTGTNWRGPAPEQSDSYPGNKWQDSMFFATPTPKKCKRHPAITLRA